MSKSEPKDPQSLPFLILGNKCDVDEGQRKVSNLEAKRLCSEENFLFYETSARDNTNIEEAIKELVTKVIERQDKLNSKILTDAPVKTDSIA